MRVRDTYDAFLRTLVCLAVLVFDLKSLPAAGELQARHLLSWGQKGDKPGEFYSPVCIALAVNPESKSEEVVVADLNNARIQRFSTDGTHLGGFDLPWDKPPRKSTMIGGMAIDGDGRIFLGFMIQHKVLVYSPTGEVVREWGKPGTGDGEFNQPGGIVLLDDGTLFINDQCNHRVQKFTTDGKFLASWGGHGAEPGQFGGTELKGSRFGGPHFLAIDSKNRLYTTEGILGRVQQLSLEGKPLLAWGDKGDQPGGFGEYTFGTMKQTFGPVGVAVDKQDRVWVSSLNDRVQCFTPDGKLLLSLRDSGSDPGELDHPHGMAFDSQGHLYVADSGNQRIQKFEILAR